MIAVASINKAVVTRGSWDWRGLMFGRQSPLTRPQERVQPRISFPPILPLAVAEDNGQDAERWDGLS